MTAKGINLRTPGLRPYLASYWLHANTSFVMLLCLVLTFSETMCLLINPMRMVVTTSKAGTQYHTMSSQQSGIDGVQQPGLNVFRDCLCQGMMVINTSHKDMTHWMSDHVISAAKEELKWKSIKHNYLRRGRDNVLFIELNRHLFYCLKVYSDIVICK